LGAAAPPVEAPLVLGGLDGRRRVVLALDAAARRVGLRVGMPAAKAQALVPGLIFRDAEPPADAKALDRLALWALQRYAPVPPPIRRTGSSSTRPVLLTCMAGKTPC
jgi:protein ImuB